MDASKALSDKSFTLHHADVSHSQLDLATERNLTDSDGDSEDEKLERSAKHNSASLELTT